MVVTKGLAPSGNEMKRALIVLLALFAVGCGGGGGSNSSTYDFAGSWEGQWVNVSEGVSGNIALDIDADGSTTGEVWVEQNNQTGELTGTIAPNGDFSFHVEFDLLDPIDSEGDAYIDYRGRLVGDGDDGTHFKLGPS